MNFVWSGALLEIKRRNSGQKLEKSESSKSKNTKEGQEWMTKKKNEKKRLKNMKWTETKMRRFNWRLEGLT